MRKAVPFVEFMYLVFTRMKDIAYSYTVAAGNDSCIKLGNGVSHHDASLIVWAQTQDSGSV